jgi:hypothetical protein
MSDLIDITGTLLTVLLNFENKGAQAPTDHNLLAFTGLLNVPPNIVALLQAPLNQLFDQVWAQQTDSNGQTMRDRAKAQIESQISSGVAKLGSSYSAYNISLNLPQAGRLRAIVISGPGANDPNVSQFIDLSYELNGISANFTVTTPYTGGLIGDPTYNLTFDIELLIVIVVPPFAGPLNTTAEFNVANANISASNVIADIGDAILTAINFLSDQPTNIFQSAEGQIDSSGGAIPNLGPLTTLISQLATVWQQAAVQVGFTQLAAFIDAQPSLNLRFTHPLDPAPTIVNAAVPPYPSLFPPQLGTSASIVQAGQSLGVTGTNFPVGQASALYIAWNDTTSGIVRESDINWGPANDPVQSVSKPRNGADGGNTFSVSNLLANTAYAFSVRDQDLITETPFGPPFLITTQPTNLVDLLLSATGGGQQTPVGSASLTGSGAFVTTVQIPQNTAAGMYTLAAALMGNILASATIQVVAASQQLPATIEVIDPATDTVLGSVEETYAFTLRGEGFQPGAVNVSIDTVNGQVLGTASGDATGSFQANFIWPRGFTGQHGIVAEEIAGNQTYQASVSVFAQALPQ